MKEIPTAFTDFSAKAFWAIRWWKLILARCSEKGEPVQILYKSDGETILWIRLKDFDAGKAFEQNFIEEPVQDFVDRVHIHEEIETINDYCRRLQWNYSQTDAYSTELYKQRSGKDPLRSDIRHIHSVLSAQKIALEHKKA